LTQPDAVLARIASRRRAKAEHTLASAASYNSKVAAAKTKTEAKSRKSLKKYHDEIKRTGKRSPAANRDAPITLLRAELNIWEMTAAEDLLAAYRKSFGVSAARESDYEAPLGEMRFDAADDHAAHQSDLAKAYQAWRMDLASSRPFAVAKDVLFAEKSLAAVDKANRWRKGTARQCLGTALRHFAALRGNTPRGSHDWKFTPEATATSKDKAA
jgi:hypothetical protein